LLSKLATVREQAQTPTPLLLKIAPDLTPEAVEEIVDIALEQGLDGLILTNTTLARPSTLQSPEARESGGLSGAPLFAPSTEILKIAARRAAGRLTIIAAGGVASGADAYAKICAGAHLVQLYSALTYEGPDLVQRIKSDLLALISADGFDNIVAAIGSKLHD
jgi:dihydroorotate dehydrogenase